MSNFKERMQNKLQHGIISQSANNFNAALEIEPETIITMQPPTML